MIIQYAQEKDRVLAELLAERLGGTAVYYDGNMPHPAISPYFPAVIIGAQVANATYRKFADLGYVPYITEADKGKGRIFVRGTLTFLAGYTADDTAAACLYVFENGLPDSDLDVNTPGKDPVIIELEGSEIYDIVGNESKFMSDLNAILNPNGSVAKFMYISGDNLKVAIWAVGSVTIPVAVIIVICVAVSSYFANRAVYHATEGKVLAQKELAEAVANSYQEAYNALVKGGVPPAEAHEKALEVTTQAAEVAEKAGKEASLKSLMYTAFGILGVGVAAYIALKFIFKD